jgi:hypothetical protein
VDDEGSAVAGSRGEEKAEDQKKQILRSLTLPQNDKVEMGAASGFVV